jgi:hypothetical protein
LRAQSVFFFQDLLRHGPFSHNSKKCLRADGIMPGSSSVNRVFLNQGTGPGREAPATPLGSGFVSRGAQVLVGHHPHGLVVEGPLVIKL